MVLIIEGKDIFLSLCSYEEYCVQTNLEPVGINAFRAKTVLKMVLPDPISNH